MAIPFLGNYPFIVSITKDFIPSDWLYRHYIVWSIPFPLCTGLFALQYLQLYKNLRWAFWLIVVQMGLVCILFPVLDLLIDTVSFVSFFQISVFTYGTSCVGVGIFIWLKKDKTIVFYILGWGAILISLFLFALTINGFIPFHPTLFNITFYGVAIEVWLFSLALANRINVLRKENHKLMVEQNQVLEQKVQERTLELQEAYEETQVMNEELRQTQEELQTQRDFVEQQNKELAQTNSQVALSINSAKTIQEAILPYEGKFADYFADYFIINRPKDVVSGDFYWFKESQERIILVVADCTGHGVPGAFMTLIGANLLDKIVSMEGIYHPDLILEALHKEIQYFLKQKHTQNNNGMDAVVITLEKQSDYKKLNFAGAKNNLLLWSGNELQELKGTRKSIGGIQNEEKRFENQEVILQEGDLLYLGSDGLEDQNNAKRKKFGKKKIQSIIQENYHISLSEQKQKFTEALQQHMEGELQRDDILWMGIKI